MKFMLRCVLAPGAAEHLAELRPRHLAFIDRHRARILFGGPLLDDSGEPEVMVMMIAAETVAAAREWLSSEPYTASGAVFTTIEIRAWRQMVPLADDAESIAFEARARGLAPLTTIGESR